MAHVHIVPGSDRDQYTEIVQRFEGAPYRIVKTPGGLFALQIYFSRQWMFAGDFEPTDLYLAAMAQAAPLVDAARANGGRY